MEASALQAPVTLAEPRVSIRTSLLRFRSDEQLVALFRAGNDEAFRAIHDRYHKRLFAYARQMLPARQDAEDALQDVFVRAYSGLRASDRELALRAWLFRVAHNRCVDELRRPSPPPPELIQLVCCSVHDPLAEVDLRESLRRLITDIRRLPDQQRSALLLRELGGMSYADLAASLGTSVAAVKSLLVRARIALAQAAEARDTACTVIREELVEAHDRGVRPNANARRHMRDCTGCKSFRRELRGVTRQLAATSPAVGPLGFLAKLLGFSGGAGGGAGGGAAILGGGGVSASAGGLALGTNHVATLIVAAVATAGGAVEIQHTIIAPSHRAAHVRSGAAGNRHHRGHGASGAAGLHAIVRVADATASTARAGASAESVATKPKLANDSARGSGSRAAQRTATPGSSSTSSAKNSASVGLNRSDAASGALSLTGGAACPAAGATGAVAGSDTAVTSSSDTGSAAGDASGTGSPAAAGSSQTGYSGAGSSSGSVSSSTTSTPCDSTAGSSGATSSGTTTSGADGGSSTSSGGTSTGTGSGSATPSGGGSSTSGGGSSASTK